MQSEKPMIGAIDWKALAATLGTIRVDGETTSSDDARRAIEVLLGEDQLRKAVDYYVADGEGRELARAVLFILRPWSAMQRCYEIYRSSADAESKHCAIELLRMVADRRALTWVREFLEDSDPQICVWGVGVLDQLLWRGLVEPDETGELLQLAERHVEPAVRERAEAMKRYLAARLERGPDA